MTAWDMVSIAIFDLTFNVAFYLLLGGGLMAGLLFLVWVTKQAVFLFLLKLGFGVLLFLWLLVAAFGDGR